MQAIFDGSFMQAMVVSESYEDANTEHRASCHRCGNIRKHVIKCAVCPHVFCKKCYDKMVSMDGIEAFENGCPHCKDLCCCGRNKSCDCTREFHCYKKCLKSRASPRSARNSSPRVAAPYVPLSNSDNGEFTFGSGRTSPMEAFLRDYTDSDEEALLQSSGLPCINEENREEEAIRETQSSERSEEVSFRHFGELRRPSGLAPIDTSATVAPSPRAADKLRSRSARAGDATPMKKLKTAGLRSQSEEDLLRTLNQANRSPAAGTAWQPPFNTGVLRIFSPHSLSAEPSPFFHQSSLPSAARLPPISTLLQFKLANPFSAYIPAALHSELPHVRLTVPAEVQASVQRGPVPDPAAGFGFSFGSNAFVGSPAASAAVRKETPQPVAKPAAVPVAVVSPPDVSGIVAEAAGWGKGVVHTPNIERACHYLYRRNAEANTTGLGDDTAADNGHEKDASGGQGRKPPARSAPSQSSQPPSQSPVAGLFCTPIATEGNASQPLTQSTSAGYDWSGGHSVQLGVKALTPAALPLCTPMTTDPPADMPPPSAVQRGPAAVTPSAGPHMQASNGAHAPVGAAYMLQPGHAFAAPLSGCAPYHAAVPYFHADPRLYSTHHVYYPPPQLQPRIPAQAHPAAGIHPASHVMLQPALPPKPLSPVKEVEPASGKGAGKMQLPVLDTQRITRSRAKSDVQA